MLVGGAATAEAAPAASSQTNTAPTVAATWQPTGEYYRYKTTCMADAAFYLQASNVYGYRCDQLDTKLFRGMVLAD
ncbi:hypothetical protein ABT030_45890 [Streptomyces mirabilis]|uniref:hypothetical protein n=1 Tax=Streptomyces mirabilis TaxID=68239 RepID=UPI00332C140A